MEIEILDAGKSRSSRSVALIVALCTAGTAIILFLKEMPISEILGMFKSRASVEISTLETSVDDASISVTAQLYSTPSHERQHIVIPVIVDATQSYWVQKNGIRPIEKGSSIIASKFEFSRIPGTFPVTLTYYMIDGGDVSAFIQGIDGKHVSKVIFPPTIVKSGSCMILATGVANICQRK